MVYCFSHTLYGKSMTVETKNVTLHNYLPAIMTNIVM